MFWKRNSDKSHLNNSVSWIRSFLKRWRTQQRAKKSRKFQSFYDTVLQMESQYNHNRFLQVPQWKYLPSAELSKSKLNALFQELWHDWEQYQVILLLTSSGHSRTDSVALTWSCWFFCKGRQVFRPRSSPKWRYTRTKQLFRMCNFGWFIPMVLDVFQVSINFRWC